MLVVGNENNKTFYMNNLITVKQFNNEEDFLEFIQILDNNSIKYETEIFNSGIDAASLRPIDKEFNVKIDRNDYSKVNNLLNAIAANDIENVDKSHYLFDFSDEELFDIIAKPDEWSAFDYQLSKRILKERGRTIDDDFLNSLKKRRIEQLAKPEASQSTWIMIGYVSAFCGGLLGIGIGWSIMASQKTLPNGEKIFSYNDEDRKNGKRIFYIGIIVASILLLWRIIEAANSI
jgi:hypothetical protein